MGGHMSIHAVVFPSNIFYAEWNLNQNKSRVHKLETMIEENFKDVMHLKIIETVWL